MKLSAVLVISCSLHLVLNGGEVGGRYALNGTFGNSDDVALLAGFAIPFLVLWASSLRNRLFRYTLLIGGCGYLLILIGRTGTRAAIPALIVMLGVYFFRGKGLRKAAIVAFAAVGVFVSILVLPDNTLDRLATITDAFDAPAGSPRSAQGMTEAEASRFERIELMQDAVAAAIHHPIVGVGAGMFVQYRFDMMRRADGSNKPYLPAHNTYLEIASDCGFPGVLLYLIFLGAIYMGIRSTRRFYKTHQGPRCESMLSITVCLEAALAYFAVCAFFMTCDKHPHQFVLAGFVIALGNLVRQDALAESPAPFLSVGAFHGMSPARAGAR